MFFGLRDYQLQGADFIGQRTHCGLFFDCGLGKTLTVLSALSHWREEMLPALIVAPKRVAHHVWPVEVEKWGFNLSTRVIDGPVKSGQELMDLTIMNPERLKIFDGCDDGFATIVVDESTYFKNRDSKRWRRLKQLCSRSNRVVLLTGTPIAGRGHLDLWAQFDLLGDANPLGTWSNFCNMHFTFDIFNRPRIRAFHDKLINEAIAPLVLRKSIDEINMPGLVEIDVEVDMPKDARRFYDDVRLEENSYAPMRTLASGFEYNKHWSGEIRPIWHHNAKIEAIKELRFATEGEKLLVFANFTEGINRLAEEFEAPYIDGRVGAGAGPLIELWNQGALPMLILHPRSAGHGLNLQQGGHRIIWFDLPDSGETYQQANARVYRSGQEAATVFIHKLICANTIDVVINGLLSKKILNEQNLLRAVQGSASHVG